MKAALKLILGVIIIFVFGLTPVVRADFKPTPEGFENAVRVFCGDPAEISERSLDPGELADYYYISENDLVVGQVLTIDVDTFDDGATLDTILEVYLDSDPDTSMDSRKPIAVGDLTSLIPLNEDPYLELPIDVLGTYYLVIYDETGENKTGAYTLSLKCADPSSIPDPVPVEVGDLLGSANGSLVKINPADGTSDVLFASLDVGSVADLEYQYDSNTLLVAVNNNPGSIISIDPDSGAVGQTFSLVSDAGTVAPRVVAIEAGENMVYGIQADSSGEQFSLVLVTMDVDLGTATLTHVVSFPWPVRALAYNQSEKMLYGASGTDLVKIDLTTSPVVFEKAPLNGLSFTIAALDFNQEDVLYGVDVVGNLLKIDHATRQVVESIPIRDSSDVTATLASADPFATISGLTFVVGEPPAVDPIKTMCSSTLTIPITAADEIDGGKLFGFKLKGHHKHHAVAFFKFQATAGESVTIRLAADEKIFTEPEKESTVYELWKHWSKSKHKGRAFLGLRAAIPGVKVNKKTKKGKLPLELTVEHLPADGWYYIMVDQPLFRFNKVDYLVDSHLTLDSSDPAGQTCQTLEVAWPSDDAEEDSASTDESTEGDTSRDVVEKEPPTEAANP